MHKQAGRSINECCRINLTVRCYINEVLLTKDMEIIPFMNFMKEAYITFISRDTK